MDSRMGHAANVRRLVWMAGFSATAFVMLPKGLAPFGILLAVTTCLMPLVSAANAAGKRRALPHALGALAAMPVFVLLVCAVSMLHSGQGWGVLDNPARLLLLPWCAWLAWSSGVSRGSLWSGAMVGLALACALAVLEHLLGAERAGGYINPLVFAHAVMVLLVAALFCRPAMKAPVWTVLWAASVAMAVVAIVLSGSRGVIPGLVLIVIASLLGEATGRLLWLKLGVVAGAALAVAIAFASVPWLAEQTRMDQVWSDVAGYRHGQVDTPIGARLELLSVAAREFGDAPFTGTGIERFDASIDASDHCRRGERRHFCDLRHAHNDVAQWGATMGIPGIVAIIAVYMVPLAVALRGFRRSGYASTRRLYLGCAALVVACLLAGMSQSTFSHAMTASSYAILAGTMLGLALRARGGEVQKAAVSRTSRSTAPVQHPAPAWQSSRRP